MSVWTTVWKWIDPNEWEIRRLRRWVRRINRLEAKIASLNDEALMAKTEEFRQWLSKGESLNSIIPEAFATVREVAKRKVGMRHFDVQLMGGIVLHQGKIAEMATGEGKTLVATLALYLNALPGKGAHLVTVNDYLARRDAMWMGPIYLALGLKVGVLQHDAAYLIDWDPTAMYGTKMVPCSRKEAYLSDITYGTNSEFGFDYLRDNMVYRTEDRVQRELFYAIVDEVDSILIDEARTPLIISGVGAEDTRIYQDVARAISTLDSERDVEVKEKEHSVVLTESGMRKVERSFGIENLYDFQNSELNQKVQQALKARYLMRRDRDYVVKDGEIIIVDEFTGRMMFGRRYSDGLHQAIEAKEKVPIRAESKTLATVTIQNYFRMYKKLAGMTGTAKTEEQEFIKIYGMSVVVIPTNRRLIRRTYPDVIYKNEHIKFRLVVKDIVEKHKRGQPVLVGTTSIEKSERLSEMLAQEGVPHFVLNAKHHEKEAEIVAQAGRFGAVTIATNMAGRGTDILLGGNPAFLAKKMLEQKGIPPDGSVEEYQKALEEARATCMEEHHRVVEVGGLHVIGTERHEARRIDNQLRGRAGRQGDPGSSMFYLSLEDDIMRRFGQDRVKWLMDKWNFPEDEPITGHIVHQVIQLVQKRVEAHNFEIRRNLLRYDDVLNKQRETIYKERNRVLTEPDFHQKVFGFMDAIIENLLAEYLPKDFPDNWRISEFIRDCSMIFPFSLTTGFFVGKTFSQIQEELTRMAYASYQARIDELGEEIAEKLARIATLRGIDNRWIDHLDQMEHLREGVSLRGYSNVHPLVIYAKEGFDLFQEMLSNIQKDIVREIFRARVEVRPASAYDTTEKVYSGPSDTVDSAAKPSRKEPQPAKNRVGRNDPCPCGSGKKYKKCCMLKAGVR